MGQVKVAAIIPAYNESLRISAVLAALLQAQSVDDIFVVDDGSSDGTAEAAQDHGRVNVIHLDANVGKGGAMWAGAQDARADVILFLDGDLIGLTASHVDALVTPVRAGDTDMAVGVFRGGRGITDLSQLLLPYISGQRAIRRSLFLSVPRVATARFAVETKLTKFAKVHRLRVSYVPLCGVTHVMKEEKLGLVRGVVSRACMYRDIALTLLRDGRA